MNDTLLKFFLTDFVVLFTFMVIFYFMIEIREENHWLTNIAYHTMTVSLLLLPVLMLIFIWI